MDFYRHLLRALPEVGARRVRRRDATGRIGTCACTADCADHGCSWQRPLTSFAPLPDSDWRKAWPHTPDAPAPSSRSSSPPRSSASSLSARCSRIPALDRAARLHGAATPTISTAPSTPRALWLGLPIAGGVLFLAGIDRRLARCEVTARGGRSPSAPRSSADRLLVIALVLNACHEVGVRFGHRPAASARPGAGASQPGSPRGP